VRIAQAERYENHSPFLRCYNNWTVPDTDFCLDYPSVFCEFWCIQQEDDGQRFCVIFPVNKSSRPPNKFHNNDWAIISKFRVLYSPGKRTQEELKNYIFRLSTFVRISNAHTGKRLFKLRSFSVHFTWNPNVQW